MSKSMSTIPIKKLCGEIEFSQLEESRFEEYRTALNEWYASLPENGMSRDFRRAPRLTEKDLNNTVAKGTVLIIGCLKTTNELVASIAIGKPRESVKNKLTSFISLLAVNTKYRRLGLGSLTFEEGLRTAKQMGTETITLRVYYDNKFQMEFMIKNNLILREIKTTHKSNFVDNQFLNIIDYYTYCCFEKNL